MFFNIYITKPRRFMLGAQQSWKAACIKSMRSGVTSALKVQTRTEAICGHVTPMYVVITKTGR